MPVKKKNQPQNLLIILLSIICVISLIIVAVCVVVFSSAIDESFYSETIINNINGKKTSLELGYDPLITVVPEELQSTSKHSKFFISDLDPKLGSDQAKVVITLWSRFDNDNAKQAYDLIEQIRSDYSPDDVAVVWKDLVNPENKSEIGWPAAIAAHCAAEQDLFWDYYKLLFENYNSLNPEFLKDLATQTALDAATFNSCLDNQETRSIVESNYYRASSYDIQTAPSVYINDELLDNLTDLDLIKAKINQLIANYE